MSKIGNQGRKCLLAMTGIWKWNRSTNFAILRSLGIPIYHEPKSDTAWHVAFLKRMTDKKSVIFVLIIFIPLARKWWNERTRWYWFQKKIPPITCFDRHEVWSQSEKLFESFSLWCDKWSPNVCWWTKALFENRRIKEWLWPPHELKGTWCITKIG